MAEIVHGAFVLCKTDCENYQGWDVRSRTDGPGASDPKRLPLGLDDEEQIKNELLQYIRHFGNYVAPSRENDYKEALLREYRKFCAAVERESKVQEEPETSKRAEKQKKKRFKLF